MFSIKVAGFLSDKTRAISRGIHLDDQLTGYPQNPRIAARAVGIYQKRFYGMSLLIKKATPASQVILSDQEVIFENPKTKM